MLHSHQPRSVYRRVRAARPNSSIPVRVLLAFLVPLAGCQQGGDRSAGTEADRSRITVLYCCDHRVFGPYFEMPAKFLVFQSLVVLDENGELEGRLARAWEHSDDYLHWTIRLRSDVTWHDGVPFTARDVEFTLNLLRHPDVLALSPSAFDLEVVDDTTLTIDLADGTGFDPLARWRVYYPRHLLENRDPAKRTSWDFWEKPVGTGAYSYVRHVPNVMTEFAAYPDYYRGRARVDRVTLKYAESSVAELLAGNVDALGWADHEDAMVIADDPEYSVYFGIYPTNYLAILWNWRVSALRDPQVRRALTLAIDRRELHRLLGFPDETPYFDVIFRRRQYRRGEVPPPLPHDRPGAARLLEGAGWVDLDGDGIRERNGERLYFELLVSPEEAKAAVFVQQELTEVGVEVDVNQLALNIVRRRISRGDFDAAIRSFHMETGGRYGAAALYGTESLLGYQNSEVAHLLEAASSTPSPDSLDALYRRLWPHFQRDLPMTHLSPGVQAFVVHRRIRGLETGSRAAPVANMEYLWIEEE